MPNDIKTTVLRESLAVDKGKDVLVITDSTSVAEYFSKEANMIGANINIWYLPNEVRPVKRVGRTLESAIKSSDVVLSVFRTFPQELDFRKHIIRIVKGSSTTRLAHMPNVDIDVITNCIVKTDINELEKLGKLLVQVLARTKKVRILSTKGTNLSLDIGGWQLPADGGFTRIETSGQWRNIPMGEAFKIPIENSANGKLVIDGAIPGKVLSRGKEIVFNIKDGRVIDIIDKSNAHFKDYLKRIDSYAPENQKGNIYKICEFGIGINRAARKVPNSIEYEKRLGTIHIAIGDNKPFAGNNEAPEHLDLLIKSPTIYFDGVKIMAKGKLIENALERICCTSIEKYRPQIDITITNSSKISRSKEEGIAMIQENKLIRFWSSPADILFDTIVGDKYSTHIAALIFEKIGRGEICLSDLINGLRITKRKCLKLIQMLYDFKIIEVNNN
jgi:hypothetical protein